jgi:putative ABC transport system permease protein
VATTAILVGTSITTTALVLLRVFPFEPRYIIPIAGMITGNAMTVTGVTMKRLREDLRLQHLEVRCSRGRSPGFMLEIRVLESFIGFRGSKGFRF